MKIPQIGTPNLNINQTSGSPPFSMPVGSPRMNIHMNDAILDTVNSSIQSISHQVQRYAQEVQVAQDNSDIKDASNKAKLAISNYMTNLDGNSDYGSYVPGLEKLKENLNNDESLKKLRPQVAESVRLHMNDMFTEATIHVNGAARKEQVGQMQTKSLARYNQAIQSNDFATAEKEVKDGVQLGYIKAQQGTELIAGIAPKIAFNQVRQEIQSGDPIGVNEKLKKRDDKGIYVNFKDLREQDREHLANAAAEQYKFQRREFLTNMEYRQAHGELTVSQVQKAIDTRMIDPDVGMRKIKELQDPNAPIPFKAEVMKQMLQAEQDYIKSPQTQEDQDVYLKSYEMNHVLLPKENRDHFRGVMEGFNKADAKYKQSTAYKVVAKIVGDAYAENQLYTDPNGPFNKQSDVATQVVNQARIMEEVDAIFKSNPEMQHNPAEAQKIATTLVKNVQNAKIIEGYSKGYNLRKDPFGKVAGKTDTEADIIRYDPKQKKNAIFDATTKQFKRWQQ